MKLQQNMYWCAAFLLAGATSYGQGAKPTLQVPATQTSPATDANIVIVPVTVRDNKGALVSSLTKDNFSLQVGGKDQSIRALQSDEGQPITVGVLVDVGRGQQNTLSEERKATDSFIDSLRPGDQAFVIHFAHDIELLQDVTGDHARLHRAVGLIGTESATFHTATDQGRVDSEQRQVHGHGTSLYDSIFLAADEIMSTQKGRKVLIVLTDGLDQGSKEALTETIESAQRADIGVYAIYFRANERPQQMQNPGQRRGGWPGSYPGSYPGNYPNGRNCNPNDPSCQSNCNPNDPSCQSNCNPNDPSCQTSSNCPNPNDPNDPRCTNNRNGTNRPNNSPAHRSYVDGKQVLDRLCGETGGGVFEVSRKLSVEQSYTDVVQELRTQYLLSFVPDGAGARDGYHRMDLRLTGAYKDKRMDIQARDGYYIGSK